MSNFAPQIPKQYKSASRSLGLALFCGSATDFDAHTTILKARLTGAERAAVAWATLRSLTPDEAQQVVDTVIPEAETSGPMAPLFSHLDQAAHWADLAEPGALEAYCLASFKAMPRPRQAAFLDFVNQRRAA